MVNRPEKLPELEIQERTACCSEKEVRSKSHCGPPPLYSQPTVGPGDMQRPGQRFAGRPSALTSLHRAAHSHTRDASRLGSKPGPRHLHRKETSRYIEAAWDAFRTTRLRGRGAIPTIAAPASRDIPHSEIEDPLVGLVRLHLRFTLTKGWEIEGENSL